MSSKLEKYREAESLSNKSESYEFVLSFSHLGKHFLFFASAFKVPTDCQPRPSINTSSLEDFYRSDVFK